MFSPFLFVSSLSAAFAAPFAPPFSSSLATLELRTAPTSLSWLPSSTGPLIVSGHGYPGHLELTRPEAGAIPTALDAGGGPAGQVSVRARDLDGDGLHELIVAREYAGAGGTTLAVHWNRPGGYVIEPLAGPPGPRELQLTDLDGDGRVDLVFATAAHRVYWMRGRQGDPGPIFVDPEPLGPPIGFPSSLRTADLDQDGRVDVLVLSRHLSHGVHLLWNDGGPGQVAMSHEHLLTQLPTAYCLADFEGAGTLSLLVALAAQPTRHVTFGAGGVPRATELQPLSLLPAARAIEWADMDGDGLGDLVSINDARTEVRIEHGLGWPQVQPPVSLAVSNANSILIGDPDGDQRQDVLVGMQQNPQLRLWRP